MALTYRLLGAPSSGADELVGGRPRVTSTDEGQEEVLADHGIAPQDVVKIDIRGALRGLDR
jgi:hypothetical protein